MFLAHYWRNQIAETLVKAMKRLIHIALTLFVAIQVRAEQNASHKIRIKILRPNSFMISQKTQESSENNAAVQADSRSDFMLNWLTSNAGKRITVASLEKGLAGSLKAYLKKGSVDILTVGDIHRELTDHLSSCTGKLLLQWTADLRRQTEHAAGIIYTITDSF